MSAVEAVSVPLPRSAGGALINTATAAAAAAARLPRADAAAGGQCHSPRDVT